MTREKRIIDFCAIIWDWYTHNRRDLPWRHLEGLSEDECAYNVLVSEIMLQQTQVPRVTILFPAFLKKFPTLSALADASIRDVLLAWRGLGYNNRALRLKRCAQEICTTYHGSFPRTFAALRALPGIGDYTAGAILNFAFNIPTPCIDVNIERIFSRVFFPPSKKSLARVELIALASDVLATAIDGRPRHDAREWHSALMDFGSIVCTEIAPRYDVCPLKKAGLYRAPYRTTKKNRKSVEPHRNGVPNRIYRGRIVDLLRDQRALNALFIGKTVCEDFRPKSDALWLRKILCALERDGLLKKESTQYSLA